MRSQRRGYNWQTVTPKGEVRLCVFERVQVMGAGWDTELCSGGNSLMRVCESGNQEQEDRRGHEGEHKGRNVASTTLLDSSS